MDWRRILPVISVIGGSIYYFYPRRRYKLPVVVFGRPDPRDDGPQRWWHVPVWIEKPASKVLAMLTFLELSDVHAEVVVSEWERASLPLRWETDTLTGVETVNFGFHPQKRESLIHNIPVAIRRETFGPAFRGIVLDAGESYLTEDNFIRHAVKLKDASLENGKKYSVTLRLWSAKYPRLAASKEYSLLVPVAGDSNNAFLFGPASEARPRAIRRHRNSHVI